LGNFFKLDEPGNFELLNQTSTRSTRSRHDHSFVDRDTLNVKSVSK